VWDERRNTSRVIPPPVGAHKTATAAMRAWVRSDLAHAKWIEDGYPTLTEAEHVARFGEEYQRRPKRVA
jgi:hypothetical protein